MSDSLKLITGHVGIIHYTIKDAAGEILDSTMRTGARAYLHGANNMLPGIEVALAGKEAGAKVSGILKPEEAFGAHDGSEPLRVRRKELPKGHDWKPGMPFATTSSSGERVQLWITAVKGAWIWVTPHHPLAGKEIEYEAQLIRVRVARQIEQDHGHPHGLDGTQGHQH